MRGGLAGVAAGAGDGGKAAGDLPLVSAQEGPAAAGEGVAGELLADFERPQDGRVHSGGVTVCPAGRLRRMTVSEEIRSGVPSISPPMVPHRAQRI